MAAAPLDQGTLKENVNEVTRVAEKDILVWTAPARPFKRRGRDFYVTLIAIAAVFGLVIFLVEGFLPVLLIISLVFLFYVLSTVEPENIEYRVTNLGIKVGTGTTSPWEILGRYWFTRRYDSKLLIIESSVFPGRLELVVVPEDEEKIDKTLTKYLVHEEVPPSNLDRAANWFAKFIPGNK